MQVSVEDEPPISLKYSTSGLISSATIWSTALLKHVRAQYFCLLPRKSFTLILYMVLSVPGRAIYHTNVLLAIGQRWVVFCQVFPDFMFFNILNLFSCSSRRMLARNKRSCQNCWKRVAGYQFWIFGLQYNYMTYWPIYFAETWNMKELLWHMEYRHYLIVVMMLMLIFWLKRAVGRFIR